MPIFTVEAPDGKRIRIEAATQAAALAGAKEHYASRAPAPKAPAKKPKVSIGEDVVRSFGSGLLKAVEGAGEYFDPYTQVAKWGDALDSMGVPLAGKVADIVRPVTAAAVSDRFGGNRVPETRPGRYAKVAGEFAPNAVMPGAGGAGALRTLVSKTASVVVPAIAAEGAREVASAAGAGETGQSLAKAGGAILGGGLTSIRVRPGGRPTLEARATSKLNAQAKQDPAKVALLRSERDAAGVPAAGVDVIDEAGRGVVRSAANRLTSARETAQEFAKGRSLNLPDRMSAQSRTHLSADPRTPKEIAADLAKARKTQAKVNYGAVRDTRIAMPEQTVTALRTDFGRDAIRQAAKGERDPEIRAELNRLADAALDDPSTLITVGMADKIARSLYGQARAQTDGNLRAILTGLGDDVREPVRKMVPDYGKAVDDFAAESKLMDAAGRGEDYLVRDTDNFVDDVKGLPQEGRALARATARRAVERASGENVSSAPGVARRIATAPEVQKRTRALLTEDEARAYERAMRLEAENVDNAQFINPRAGSKTASQTEDTASVAGEAAGLASNVATQNWLGAGVGAVRLFLKGQGLSNKEAEALVKLATDPARVREFEAALVKTVGPSAVRRFLKSGAVATVPLLTTAGAPAPDRPAR